VTPATAAGTHYHCRTLATVELEAAGTIETSQTLTAEGRTATSGTPATVETPTTVLALEGTQTATVWSPITYDC
jgi:hypothetical protein